MALGQHVVMAWHNDNHRRGNLESGPEFWGQPQWKRKGSVRQRDRDERAPEEFPAGNQKKEQAILAVQVLRTYRADVRLPSRGE